MNKIFLLSGILMVACTAPDELLVAHREKGVTTCTIGVHAPEYEDMDTSVYFDSSACHRAPAKWVAGPG